MNTRSFFALGLCLLIPILNGHPQATADSQWLSLGGDFARTGTSPNDGLAQGGMQWQYEVGAALVNSITVGPEGRIHVACQDGRLSTLSADGQRLWVADVNSPLLSAPSIGPDGSLFVGSKDGCLYAVGSEGQIRWSYQTGQAIYSSPAIDPNGNIYFGSSDGTLYALDPNGAMLWRFKTRGAGGLTAGAIFASPAIGQDGTLYIGGVYDPNLYALNPIDGTVKWTCNFALYPEDDSNPNSPLTGGRFFASPVVGADGTIYQTLLFDSHLYAIEPENGAIRWSVDLLDTPAIPTDPEDFAGDADGWSEPALGPDGTIYVSLDDPYLRAVDPNGTILWATQLGDMGGFTLTVDRIGRIYAAADDGHVYVVEADDTLIGRFATEGWPAYPVIASDGTLIVTDTKDNSTLATETGNVIQSVSVESLIETLDQ